MNRIQLLNRDLLTKPPEYQEAVERAIEQLREVVRRMDKHAAFHALTQVAAEVVDIEVRPVPTRKQQVREFMDEAEKGRIVLSRRPQKPKLRQATMVMLEDK